jgi:predicted metal-binding membrane protein
VLASKRDRRIVVTALGVTQIFAWGSSYYLLAVLAKPIARAGWGHTLTAPPMFELVKLRRNSV